ncbi:metal-dependent hydrolase [Schlesneria paludicola]|uniref:metal-dependent hydrolase n=1 Tax=Schlesneria paludicola TaxID=360056 RepID=UPI00029B3307|nr:metal-dependent hydrolase [Schlesneria paludicola]
MAGFHTHITVSTVVGAAYAFVGVNVLNLPLSTCAIGGGLCSIAGIMPDLDSDHAIPARETLSFLAAVAPMLLFYRFHYEGLATENILLFGAPLYLLIRFGCGQMLRVSVHRGMFHSLPAAAIAGLIAYCLCDTGVSTGRNFKAVGATIGYLVHLLLDEIWAVEFSGVHLRLKKSFGTAMKFFGNSPQANSGTWALLAGLSFFAAHDQGHPEIAAPFMRANPGQLEPNRAAIRNLSDEPIRPASASIPSPPLMNTRIQMNTRQQPAQPPRHGSRTDAHWR